MFHIGMLFAFARFNPDNPMNQPGRLTGRHCRARLQRVLAKRARKGRTTFNAAGAWRQRV